jgi:hypothetical protein
MSPTSDPCRQVWMYSRQEAGTSTKRFHSDPRRAPSVWKVATTERVSRSSIQAVTAFIVNQSCGHRLRNAEAAHVTTFKAPRSVRLRGAFAPATRTRSAAPTSPGEFVTSEGAFRFGAVYADGRPVLPIRK